MTDHERTQIKLEYLASKQPQKRKSVCIQLTDEEYQALNVYSHLRLQLKSKTVRDAVLEQIGYKPHEAHEQEITCPFLK